MRANRSRRACAASVFFIMAGAAISQVPVAAAAEAKPVKPVLTFSLAQQSLYSLVIPNFVTRQGAQLLLDGKPYRFTGLNIYNATNTAGCWYGLGANLGLNESLTAIGPGQTVFRAWFFQAMATTGGQRDWSAFDRTLAVARAHDERVIATLANQWGDCEENRPDYKTESWYRSGYRTTPEPGMRASYRNWVAEVVARYRDNPTILAWQLMNEAEDMTGANGRCTATASATLKAFTADMAGLVKGLDPNHLLSLGTWGVNACGIAGRDYLSVHSVAGIDLCEYHDYFSPSSAMPGALQVRLNQCRSLGKPLFVGETGIRLSEVGSAENRAAAFQAKFAAQFQAGVAGELVWDWRDADQDAYSGYEVGPNDPVLAVISELVGGASGRQQDAVQAPLGSPGAAAKPMDELGQASPGVEQRRIGTVDRIE